MATETKSLWEAMCPVIRCNDEAHYRTTKNPQVLNYRCRTRQHWGHLRPDALAEVGTYIQLEAWAEILEDRPLQDELRRVGESMQ